MSNINPKLLPTLRDPKDPAQVEIFQREVREVLRRLWAALGEATTAVDGIDIFTDTEDGLTPASGGGTLNFLRADGTWAAPTGATVADADYGDITVSGSGTVWNIDASAVGTTELATDSVTDTRLRNSVGDSVIGRATNSTGDPADIVASSDGDVLRRSGTTLGFGAIPESSVTSLTADLAARPTGSGTSGKSTRWTGTSTLGDGAFTDNGTEVSLTSTTTPLISNSSSTTIGQVGLKGTNVASPVDIYFTDNGNTIRGAVGYGNASLADATRRQAMYVHRSTTADFVVTRGSGTSSLDLVVSGTNGRVGIGTVAAPSAALDLNGINPDIFINGSNSGLIRYHTAGINPPTFTSRSSGTKIVFYPLVGAANVDYAMGIDNNELWQSVTQAVSGARFRWYGGTTAIAALDGTGRFAIGTHTPTQFIDVRASLSAAELVQLRNTSTSGFSSVGYYDNGGTIRGELGYGNASVADTSVASRLFVRTKGSNLVVTNGTAATSTVAAMLFDATGNVNIGTSTTDPSAKLRVQAGTSTAATAAAGTVLHLEQADGSANYLTFRGTSTKGIAFANASTNLDGGIFYDGFAGTRGFIMLSANTQRMQLDSNGGMFIGDTTNTAIGSNVDVFTIGNTGTGQTSSTQLIDATHTGSFNTTAGALSADGVSVSMTSTRSAGANNLTNRAAVFAASGAQVNYAIETTAGDVKHSANFTVNGNCTLGDSTSDSHTITGQVAFPGTNWNSIINYTGSANQDSYLRAGVTAGFVNIGDVNTGGVNIGSASNATSVAGTLNAVGNLTVNTNKFTVTASNGNTVVAGTFNGQGAADFDSTLNVDGNTTMNGNVAIGNGTGDTVAFYGAAGSTQQTVTGSRGGNAALASLLTALATLGVIVDSSSA